MVTPDLNDASIFFMLFDKQHNKSTPALTLAPILKNTSTSETIEEICLSTDQVEQFYQIINHYYAPGKASCVFLQDISNLRIPYKLMSALYLMGIEFLNVEFDNFQDCYKIRTKNTELEQKIYRAIAYPDTFQLPSFNVYLLSRLNKLRRECNHYYRSSSPCRELTVNDFCVENASKTSTGCLYPQRLLKELNNNIEQLMKYVHASAKHRNQAISIAKLKDYISKNFHSNPDKSKVKLHMKSLRLKIEKIYAESKIHNNPKLDALLTKIYTIFSRILVFLGLKNYQDHLESCMFFSETERQKRLKKMFKSLNQLDENVNNYTR